MAAANLRFGDGVTREVGMDLKNMKARKVSVQSFQFISRLCLVKVALFTDNTLLNLPPVLKVK